MFDGYTEVVHEYLALAFTIFAAFHIAVNWKALKFHFGKKVFLPASGTVLIIALALVVLEKMNPPVDLIIINRLVKAPIPAAFEALGVDYTEAVQRLEDNDIPIGNAQILEDIWINNAADPEQVIYLITW